MALKGGTINDFNNSMAEAMENAFKKEWPNAMGDAPVPASNKQMRLMFVAIAKGVLEHLSAHHSDFKVHTTITDATNTNGEVNQIIIS